MPYEGSRRGDNRQGDGGTGERRGARSEVCVSEALDWGLWMRAKSGWVEEGASSGSCLVGRGRRLDQAQDWALWASRDAVAARMDAVRPS
jgi:hypothetical protein